MSDTNMNILKNHKWDIIVIHIGLALLISAILHRLQLNISDQVYTQSIWINFEILFMVSIILMTLINVILLFKNLIKKKLREASVTAAIIATSIVVLIAAMAIDAPTLVYMT